MKFFPVFPPYFLRLIRADGSSGVRYTRSSAPKRSEQLPQLRRFHARRDRAQVHHTALGLLTLRALGENLTLGFPSLRARGVVGKTVSGDGLFLILVLGSLPRFFFRSEEETGWFFASDLPPFAFAFAFFFGVVDVSGGSIAVSSSSSSGRI